MTGIQRDLMYLKARFPSLTLFLEDIDEKDVGPLVKRIDGIVSRLASDQEQSPEVLERAQDLQAHWEDIKGRIKPHAKVDTSVLIEDIEHIRGALLSSSSASSGTISVGSDDEPSSVASSTTSDSEPSPEEEVLEVELSARYQALQYISPKLIAAFRHVLEQAKGGAFGEKVQGLLDESAPEVTELRPLLRVMLLEIIDNPELAPEFIENLEKLDTLKALLPDDTKARSELREGAILGELPKEHEALANELNRLVGAYSSAKKGQLEKDFKDISRVLFPEILLGAKVPTSPPAISVPEGLVGSEAINAWLSSIPNPEVIEEIDLQEAGLTAYPEALSRFPNLKHLDLRFNAIDFAHFPEISEHWSHLESLDLAGCKLKTLPESAASWGQLERLDLSGNYLESLPSLVGNWSRLEFLSIRNNKLASLPDEVGNWSQLGQLYLGNNKLASLPESVSGWTRLKKLFLPNNLLTTLPDGAGRWSQLRELSIRSNRFTTFPAAMTGWEHLGRLNVRGNPNLVIPNQLMDLVNNGQIDLRGDLEHFGWASESGVEPDQTNAQAAAPPSFFQSAMDWVRSWFRDQ